MKKDKASIEKESIRKAMRSYAKIQEQLKAITKQAEVESWSLERLKKTQANLNAKAKKLMEQKTDELNLKLDKRQGKTGSRSAGYKQKLKEIISMWKNEEYDNILDAASDANDLLHEVPEGLPEYKKLIELKEMILNELKSLDKRADQA